MAANFISEETIITPTTNMIIVFLHSLKCLIKNATTSGKLKHIDIIHDSSLNICPAKNKSKLKTNSIIFPADFLVSLGIASVIQMIEIVVQTNEIVVKV